MFKDDQLKKDQEIQNLKNAKATQALEFKEMQAQKDRELEQLNKAKIDEVNALKEQMAKQAEESKSQRARQEEEKLAELQRVKDESLLQKQKEIAALYDQNQAEINELRKVLVKDKEDTMKAEKIAANLQRASQVIQVKSECDAQKKLELDQQGARLTQQKNEEIAALKSLLKQELEAYIALTHKQNEDFRLQLLTQKKQEIEKETEKVLQFAQLALKNAYSKSHNEAVNHLELQQ